MNRGAGKSPLSTTGRTFSWWVGPASGPDGLPALLTAAGLVRTETGTAMWTRLGELPDGGTVAGLQIVPVSTREQVRDRGRELEPQR